MMYACMMYVCMMYVRMHDVCMYACKHAREQSPAVTIYAVLERGVKWVISAECSSVL